MISALAWVRKGAAAERPAAYEMTEDEYKRIQQIAATEISDAKQELKEKAQLDDAILNDPALKDFDLEHYDSDPSEDANDDQEESGPNVFSNIKGLAYHNEDEEDPYITMKGADEDEQEEVRVFGTDNLLLVAKTEDDMSNLEVCVFEDESDNLFVHHDFMLPAFPLCLEWLDYRVGRTAGQQTPGSFVAVGTFEPRIEIWDLDTLDSMYPDLVLGSTDKRQLRKLKGKPHAEFHTDAVMDLSWNRNVRNLLASSSADTTVKLWDLNTGKCAQSYGHHSDKVQAVKWHPTEASVMLSGGYDQKVAAFDSRAPDAITWWSSGSDVESLMWDIHSPSNFFVATDAGEVRYHDIRQPGSAVFVLAAHDEAVSAMDQHPSVPNVLVTGSVDQSVKVWTTKDNKPSMVLSRNLDVGSVFAAKFCPDSTMQLAVGGSQGEYRIWDMSTNAGVRATFGDASVQASSVVEKPLVGVQNDDDEGDDDDDDNNEEAVLREMHADIKSDDDDEDDDDDDEEMASDDE